MAPEVRTVLAPLVLLLVAGASSSQAASITCPPNVTTTASPGTCAQQVGYGTPTVSGAVLLGCDPTSGSSFPVGATLVSCGALNGSPPPVVLSCAFTVTVVDTEPPVIVCPENVDTGSDEDACGARVEFMPTASDACPGLTTGLQFGLPSGTVFPVGTTLVGPLATDASTNTASCTFTVKVADTVPPRITCPADIAVPAPGPVEYAVVAEDACDVVETTLSQPSGSIFRAARTVVGATARDAAGNTASCTFAVLVAPSTTSTTLPPPAGCAAGPTFASIGCRLIALGPAVSGAVPEPARERLTALLARVAALVGTAESHEAAGRRRPTRAALRKALARIGRFRKRVLGSKSAIPEPARTALAEQAESIRQDLRMLLGS
jgi:hypothetical protein